MMQHLFGLMKGMRIIFSGLTCVSNPAHSMYWLEQHRTWIKVFACWHQIIHKFQLHHPVFATEAGDLLSIGNQHTCTCIHTTPQAHRVVSWYGCMTPHTESQFLHVLLDACITGTRCNPRGAIASEPLVHNRDWCHQLEFYILPTRLFTFTNQSARVLLSGTLSVDVSWDRHMSRLHTCKPTLSDRDQTMCAPYKVACMSTLV